MADTTSTEQLKAVYEELKKEDVRKIVLFGEPGVGKTWMARKLSDHAIKDQLFNFSLWLSLNREYESNSLCESITRQLSLLHISDEWDLEDSNYENLDKNDANLGQKKEDLRAKTFEALEGKKFLLILDDEGSQKTECEIVEELKYLLPLDNQASHKFIITSTRSGDATGPEEKTKVINVQPLSESESLHLVEKIVGMKIDATHGIRDLASYFLGKSKRLPYEVIMIGKALSYFGRDESGQCMLKYVKEEKAEQYNILQLLSYGYEPLPRKILVDCCWIDNHFLRKRGSVYYNELISYWILEGYLGNFNSIENAYKVGHSVLMELIDCGLLKQLDSGHVRMREAKYDVNDLDYFEFAETTLLGLATVFDGDLGRTVQGKGMIKTGCAGQVQKNVSTLILDLDHLDSEVPGEFFRFRKELEILAIFYPGFQSLPLPLSEMHKLRLLVLRGCNHLESIEHILKFKNPTVSENSSFVFQELTVLEISGSSPLKKIPDDLFNHMVHLKTLNFSSLQIESLPSSLFSLKELVWLILRQCSCLQELRSLKMLSKLQVLDLSGASSLKTIQDKSLFSNRELRILNLSQSQIVSLPLLRDLSKLTHLLLRDCTQLERLRKVTALSCLQILDLSGSTNFNEFVDPSFEKLTSLKVIDVSRTAVGKLPFDISCLHELRISDCSKIKELPFEQPIEGLQVLNLSGSHHLEDIGSSFFARLNFLQELNLSNTDIKCLPDLSDLHNLRCLLLSHCSALESLGELRSTTKLEILDLSGCVALKEIQGKSLEHMNRLQKLDLSETNITCLPPLSSTDLRLLILKSCSNLKELPSLKDLSRLEELNLSGVRSIGGVVPDLEHMTNLRILDLSETSIEKLPSLSNLKNLKYLSLRGCPSLMEFPGLEALTKLEVLDLSGTAVKDLPSLKSFANLQRLLLKGCFSLEKFKQLDIHEVLEATLKELPYEISKVTSIQQLEPPIFAIEGRRTEKLNFTPEDPNQFQWSIFNWSRESFVSNKLTITLNGVEILQLLEENPLLLETQFHFFVHPVEPYGKFGDNRFYRNELFLRDLYFRTRQLSTSSERLRSLDIRGFDCFPRCLGLILVHAKFVFLVDNPFVTCLSDLGADEIKNMKACWIERCTEMEYIFHKEEVEDAARSGGRTNTEAAEENDGVLLGTWKCLEILSVACAPKLKSMCRGNLHKSSLKNLKCLSLEYCSQISAVSSAPEQLGNLETLQIKFCHKLVALFEHEQAAFLNLHTLKLWALPELKGITCDLPVLQTLVIGDCSMIVKVFSSTQFPKELKNLQIKFCDSLETIFDYFPLKRTLPNLQKLCLWDLPELKDIGAGFPALQENIIRECPKLP